MRAFSLYEDVLGLGVAQSHPSLLHAPRGAMTRWAGPRVEEVLEVSENLEGSSQRRGGYVDHPRAQLVTSHESSSH